MFAWRWYSFCSLGWLIIVNFLVFRSINGSSWHFNCVDIKGDRWIFYWIITIYSKKWLKTRDKFLFNKRKLHSLHKITTQPLNSISIDRSYISVKFIYKNVSIYLVLYIFNKTLHSICKDILSNDKLTIHFILKKAGSFFL